MKTQKFGMNRLQWILTGVLVAQIILAVVVNLPKSIQASGGPLIDGFDPAKIAGIWIENQSGDRIHLQKIDGEWALPDRGNYPVQEDNVSELLEKIQKVQTNRMVTQTAASHSQLKVAEDEFVSKIILEESDGRSHILYIGSSGGTGATHIRISGSNQVYLTAELSSWEVTPTMSSWIDATYLSLDQNLFQSLHVQNANGIFDFVKGSEGEWTYADLGEGEVFDANTFQTTVGRLSSMQMLEPLGTEVNPSLGFTDPAATVVIEVKDDSGSTSQLVVTIGGVLGGDYTVKASSSPYYVKIASVYASSLVDMNHERLLEVEPTPTLEP